MNEVDKKLETTRHELMEALRRVQKTADGAVFIREGETTYTPEQAREGFEQALDAYVLARIDKVVDVIADELNRIMEEARVGERE